MKILKPFTKWWNKTGAESKTTKEAYSDYTPSKDFYKSIREREQAEKKRYEKWRKEIKSMSTYNSNNPNIYGGGGFGAITGYTPGSIGSKTITTTNLADSDILSAIASMETNKVPGIFDGEVAFFFVFFFLFGTRHPSLNSKLFLSWD